MSLLLVFLAGCWCGALMRYSGLFAAADLLACKPICCMLKVLGARDPTLGFNVFVGLFFCVAWLFSGRFLRRRYETANCALPLIWHLPLLLCVYFVMQWIGWNQIAFSDCKLGALAQYVGICCGTEAAVLVFSIEVCCAWAILHFLSVILLRVNVCGLRMVVAISVFLFVAAMSRFRVPPQLHLHFTDFYCADRCYLTSIHSGDWWTLSETDDCIEFRGESSMVPGLNGPENEKRIHFSNSSKYGFLVREEEEVYCSIEKDTSGDKVERRVKFRVVDISNEEMHVPIQLRIACEYSRGRECMQVSFQEAIEILSKWDDVAARKIANSVACRSVKEDVPPEAQRPYHKDALPAP